MWPQSDLIPYLFALCLLLPIYTITGYDASAHTSGCSLGELDFSDTLAESISDTARKTEDMDLDLDLDFDLDLGGLSIHKEA